MYEEPTHEPTDSANHAASVGAADGKTGRGLSAGALAGIGVGIFVVVCLALYFMLSNYQKGVKGSQGPEAFYSDDIYGRKSHESNNNFAPHVRQGRNSLGNSLGAGRSSGSFTGSSPVYDPSVRLSINAPPPSRMSINGHPPGLGGPRRPSLSAGSALAPSPSTSPLRPVSNYGPPPAAHLPKGGVRGSFSAGPGLRTSAKHEYAL